MAKKQWILHVTKRITAKNEIFFRIVTNQKDSEQYPSINIDWDEALCKPKRDIKKDLLMLFNDHKEFPTFRLFFTVEDALLGKNPVNKSMPNFLEQTLKIEQHEIAFFRKVLIDMINE